MTPEFNTDELIMKTAQAITREQEASRLRENFEKLIRKIRLVEVKR